jgi:diguanylate cyclase (GGDEF)-like protein
MSHDRSRARGRARSAMPSRAAGVMITLTAGVLATLFSLAGPAPTIDDLTRVALLLILAAVLVEMSTRRIPPGTSGLDAVWTFAGALLLPPSVLVGLAVVVCAHRSVRERHAPSAAVLRAAAVVLACLSARAVVRIPELASALSGALPALAVLAGAGLAYATVDGTLAFVTARTDPDAAGLLPAATLCLGALVALALPVNPALVALALPALLLLGRAARVGRLAHAAQTDGKTGLLNAGTWHEQAGRTLAGCGRAAVLVVDLDHFKEVNDRFGHLTGDRVLAAVADALRAEVRDGDVVGRFGGEEFVVLLTGDVDDPGDALAVADRIRTRIAQLCIQIPRDGGTVTVTGLTTSVGAAVSPDHGLDLRTLLAVADTALYGAKRAGRNAVRMGGLHLPEQRDG